MTTQPEAINAMPAQPISSTPQPDAIKAPDLTPAAAWSRRVRRIGEFIQAALAVTTGIAAGVILLAATAGFHDLAAIRAARPPGPASLGTKG
jgi:hypothetical protein